MAQFVTRGDRSGLYITDFEELYVELGRIQPTLVTQLRKDFRDIAKPVQQSVKNAIPDVPPTSGIHKKRRRQTRSGFYPIQVPGRLTWGPNAQNRNKQADSVAIQTAKPSQVRYRMKSNKMSQTAIARLKVDNAATVLADLAGSSGAWVNRRPVTREYQYSRSATGYRVHRINGQGVAMIRALKGKGSRFVWPAARQSVPKTYRKTQDVLSKAYARINQDLRS